MYLPTYHTCQRLSGLYNNQLSGAGPRGALEGFSPPWIDICVVFNVFKIMIIQIKYLF